MTKTNLENDVSGKSCWVITNGMAGFETQALGVAEALGLKPEVKQVHPSAPWRWFAPRGPAAPNPEISEPWPDLLIASGRQSIPYARAIKRRSGGKTFTVILQNPRVPPSEFDLVWTPSHDRLEAPNVISTLVSPHRLTPLKLASEGTRLAPEVAHLPHPRVAVLLGGTNAVYKLSEHTASLIGAKLAKLADESGAGLMVTPSRRTGIAQTAAIYAALKDKSAIIWDGKGDNPYFGFLSHAEAIIVTSDSVNMVGEAAFTGKPVHVIELEGGSRKFRRFLDGMYASGAARPFAINNNGWKLESWDYEPLNATHVIADAIAKMLAARNAIASLS